MVKANITLRILITSFQLTGFAIVVITNASDTECIFWTQPAGTCCQARVSCCQKLGGVVHASIRFVLPNFYTVAKVAEAAGEA
jgi:hypothetical protein